jgi:hypothetical protein
MHHSDFNLATRAGFTALLHYFRCPLTCPAITTAGVNVHKLPVSLTRITFIGVLLELGNYRCETTRVRVNYFEWNLFSRGKNNAYFRE